MLFPRKSMQIAVQKQCFWPGKRWGKDRMGRPMLVNVCVLVRYKFRSFLAYLRTSGILFENMRSMKDLFVKKNHHHPPSWFACCPSLDFRFLCWDSLAFGVEKLVHSPLNPYICINKTIQMKHHEKVVHRFSIVFVCQFCQCVIY